MQSGLAAANAAEPAAKAAVVAVPKEPGQAVAPKIEWRDEMSVTLTPGEGTEIKMKLAEGAKSKAGINEKAMA